MSNKYHCNHKIAYCSKCFRLTCVITRYNGFCFGKNCITVEKIATFATFHPLYSKDDEQNSG